VFGQGELAAETGVFLSLDTATSTICTMK
jgi:hypothetical protein